VGKTIDEGFWAGDKSAEGVLKALITEPTIMIERKGVDARSASNYIRFIMASNNAWVVPAGFGERRFAVLDVGKEHKEDRPYFAAIETQLANGGLAALLHYLLHEVDLAALKAEGIDPTVIPQTPALLEQKLRSMKPEEQWWVSFRSARLTALAKGQFNSRALLTLRVIAVQHLPDSSVHREERQRSGEPA
jgi:hypothetical protein